MKKLNAFSTIVVMVIAFFSMFLVSCGGEDCTGDECNEPDNEIVDDATDTEIPDSDQEPVDNQTDDVIDSEPNDETPDDDGLVDIEPNDDDFVPVPCNQDETCKEICKNFLVFAGDWNMIEITGDTSINLSVEDSVCKISVTGKWTFEWKGTEIPLECTKATTIDYFFYLVGMENDKMVWIKSGTMENCQAQNGPQITFTRK